MISNGCGPKRATVPDNRRVAAEAPLKELVAEDRLRWGRWRGGRPRLRGRRRLWLGRQRRAVGIRKVVAERDPRSEHTEEVRRRGPRPHLFHFRATLHREHLAARRQTRHTVERRLRDAQVMKVGRRPRKVFDVAGPQVVGNVHEAVRPIVRQRS